MEGRPKIIIVDDHALFREGIKLLIEMEGIGEVIAEAENGCQFLDLLEKQIPDLILMDIEMPVMGGLEATIKAIDQMPQLKILVLTMLGAKDNYTAMINAGAQGFILKTSGKQELEKAIRTVIRGESYFSGELMRSIITNIRKQSTVSSLFNSEQINISEREMEVLQGFCNGLTATEIADQLCRSVKTVEAHRSKLLLKTHSKNTINLVLYALKNKLVEL